MGFFCHHQMVRIENNERFKKKNRCHEGKPVGNSKGRVLKRKHRQKREKKTPRIYETISNSTERYRLCPRPFYAHYSASQYWKLRAQEGLFASPTRHINRIRHWNWEWVPCLGVVAFFSHQLVPKVQKSGRDETSLSWNRGKIKGEGSENFDSLLPHEKNLIWRQLWRFQHERFAVIVADVRLLFVSANRSSVCATFQERIYCRSVKCDLCPQNVFLARVSETSDVCSLTHMNYWEQKLYHSWHSRKSTQVRGWMCCDRTVRRERAYVFVLLYHLHFFFLTSRSKTQQVLLWDDSVRRDDWDNDVSTFERWNISRQLVVRTHGHRTHWMCFERVVWTWRVFWMRKLHHQKK